MLRLLDRALVDKEHPIAQEGGSGRQRIYRFKNGFGASVVRFRLSLSTGSDFGSYTSDDREWELAVIRFTGEGEDDFKLTYETVITDDVLGHLTEQGVEDVLRKIALLNKCGDFRGSHKKCVSAQVVN